VIDVRVADDAITTMTRHAAAGAPREVCGFLVGSRCPTRVDVTRAVVATNDAERAEREFRIHARELLQLEDGLEEGEQIVGLYHSHPEQPAVPSPADAEHAAPWRSLVHAIVSVRGGRARSPRFYSADERASGRLVECRVGGSALLSSAGS
jgi:desampylase